MRLAMLAAVAAMGLVAVGCAKEPDPAMSASEIGEEPVSTASVVPSPDAAMDSSLAATAAADTAKH